MDLDIVPIDHSPAAREFLFACAYWIIAADSQLKSEEQDWLIEQFGPEEANRLLDRYIQLMGDDFFRAFDQSLGGINDKEKFKIYPGLCKWLSSCLTADGELRPEEHEIMRAIVGRISLDTELKRLKKTVEPDRKPTPPPLPTQETRRAPPPLPETVEPEDDVVAEEPPEVVAEEPVAEEVIEQEPTPAAAIEEPAGEPVVVPIEGHTEEVTALSAHPDGQHVLSGSQDTTARLWRFETGEEVSSFTGHEAAISAVAILPDGHSAISADRIGTVIRWDLETSDVQWTLNLDKIGGLSALAVSPSGKLAAACSLGARVVIIDLDSGKAREAWRKPGWNAFRSVAFSPDGESLAIVGDDRLVRFLSITDGEEHGQCMGHTSIVLDLAFTSDGSHLVTGSRDNTVRVWDVEHGAEVRRIFGHTFSVYGVDVDAAGRWIVSASWDHTAKVWDPATGKALLNYENHEGRFNKAVCLPDSTSAVLACSDKNLYAVTFPL